jgi:hypothetical protein
MQSMKSVTWYVYRRRNFQESVLVRLDFEPDCMGFAWPCVVDKRKAREDCGRLEWDRDVNGSELILYRH